MGCRRSIFDAPRGPKRPISTALTPAEEALVVIFRQRTSLPLDDCLARLTPLIPALSRSALHRCMRRYRISRIPKGRPEKLRARQIPDSSAHFTIEIHALTYGLGGSYFYVAINFAKFVFAKLVGEVSADAAAAFLEDLIIHAPIGVATVETNNHEAFSDSEESRRDPKHPSRLHPFARGLPSQFHRPHRGAITKPSAQDCFEGVERGPEQKWSTLKPTVGSNGWNRGESADWDC